MKECILCNKQTEGSIGAAGIKWPNICQPCKDKEDTMLLRRIEVEGKMLSKFLTKFNILH